MDSIKILASGMYLPQNIIDNEKLNKKFLLEENWIYKRTGIKNRFKIADENIVDLAIKATQNLIEKQNIDIKKVDLIITATTSSNRLMPGISFEIQKEFNIPNCMCLDVLAGCSGYINAFDIARKYIALNEANCALIIGTEVLTDYLSEEDISTSILLGDGAGALLLGKSETEKTYSSYIESQGQEGDILTCYSESKIYMNGKKIYKYGISETAKNVNKLLEKSNENIENIKYIVPHQSNARIMEKICENLKIDKSKMYIDIEEVGNTFCASIPIALSKMYDKNLIKENDKIILLGYGGGLNTGSILLEI